MRDLAAGQPRQQQQVAELSSVVRGYVSDYGEPLIDYRVSHKAARSPVATREGAFQVDDSRSSAASWRASRRSPPQTRPRPRAGRERCVGIAAPRSPPACSRSTPCSCARDRPVHSVADGASRVAAGDLSTRLPEVGAAEILDLSRSFNAMARSLEQSKRELETQNEQLRQSERLKSELVSIVSHELRTPLASIMGYASLLLKRDFRKADAERFSRIHGQSRLSCSWRTSWTWRASRPGGSS
jgi:hypothetical protein